MLQLGLRPELGQRPQVASQVGETNQIAQVINNFNIGGDSVGAGIPGLGFGPRPVGDLCEFGGRPPMDFGGHHCGCDCGGSELADFGNSSMGKRLGEAAKYNSIFGGFASILAALNPAALVRAAQGQC